MRFLVAYATTEGHTRKIAEWIGDWLRSREHAVLVLDTAAIADDLKIDRFDSYVLAGSVHMGKHQPALVQFVLRNLAVLQRAPSALISASGTAARTDPASLGRANACIEAFVKATGWRPSATMPVGGAVLYTQYNFILRWIMKLITKGEGGPTDTSRDHEFTDWHALEDFLSGFLSRQDFEKELPPLMVAGA